MNLYVTVPGKRAQVPHIMNFCLGGFSATIPNNKSRDKTFMFVSEVSPTLCLHSRSVEALLKGQARCLKAAN